MENITIEVDNKRWNATRILFNKTTRSNAKHNTDVTKIATADFNCTEEVLHHKLSRSDQEVFNIKQTQAD